MNQLGLGERELAEAIGIHADKKWAQLYLRSVGQDVIFDKTKWNWPVNTESVMAELKKGPLVVLMAQDPYNDHENDTANQLLKITDNFVILSGNGKYFSNPKKHICYFPYTFLTQKLNLEKVGVGPALASNNSCSYTISSLGGKSRYHRIEDFLKLREKSYFDKLLITIHDNFNFEECKLETQIEFWNHDIVSKFQALIDSGELQRGYTNDHSTTHPAYTDSYINYVTETSIRTTEIYQSEKTFKPFVSGQFGVWLSNPGHVGFLRATGWDVFDDVFDNHAYDRETNLNQRINQIHNLFDNIMSADLTSVYQSTLARRQANIDWFYSNDLETLVTAQCEDYQL
jgi:hypothetical protein